MPVKRKTAKFRMGALPEAEADILNDRKTSADFPGWKGYVFTYNQAGGGVLGGPSLGDYWARHGEEITADWAAARPGTRPSFWWKFSAPRWIDFDPVMAEPRLMLSGSGMPDTRLSNPRRYDLLQYHLGVPLEWIEFDPSAPPTFESQAAYLGRHGLFLPGERKRLTAADFTPEAVAAPELERDDG